MTGWHFVSMANEKLFTLMYNIKNEVQTRSGSPEMTNFDFVWHPKKWVLIDLLLIQNVDLCQTRINQPQSKLCVCTMQKYASRGKKYDDAYEMAFLISNKIHLNK